MNELETPAWLTATDLIPPIKQLLERKVTAIDEWTIQPLAGGAGVGLGVWQASGRAHTESGPLPWHLVLKGWRSPDGDSPATSIHWAHRERDLYLSGILRDLPDGIRAPACYGCIEREDGSVWLCLETLTFPKNGSWDRHHYDRVARQLGRFNGAYLTDRRLPDHPALSRRWLRQWVETAQPLLDQLETDARHPIVRKTYPPAVVEAFRHDWATRHHRLDMIERLPHVFCHLDAFNRNIIPGQDDQTASVLIDWSFAGIAALGEELAPMVAAALAFMDAEVSDAGELYDVTLSAYLAGLRDAGWSGDEREIRSACDIATRLRFGIGAMHVIFPLMRDAEHYPWLEKLLGHRINEIAEHYGMFNTWLISLAHTSTALR